MLHRIDIVLEVAAVEFEALRKRAEAEPSFAIKARVNAARKIQNERFADNRGMCNARMGPHEMRTYCQLDENCEALMYGAFEKMGLTARSYDRILRVARTIADLDGSEQIQVQHLAEAVRYRTVKIANQN